MKQVQKSQNTVCDSELLYQDSMFSIVKQIDGYYYVCNGDFTICVCEDYPNAIDVIDTIHKNSIIFI